MRELAARTRLLVWLASEGAGTLAQDKRTASEKIPSLGPRVTNVPGAPDMATMRKVPPAPVMPTEAHKPGTTLGPSDPPAPSVRGLTAVPSVPVVRGRPVRL